MKEGQLSQHVWQGDFLSGDKAPNGSGEANEVQFALALMDYVHTPNMTYLCLVSSHWNKLSISTPLLYIPLIGDCQSAFHCVSGLVHDSSFCLLVGLTPPPPVPPDTLPSIHLHVQLLMPFCDNFPPCQEAASIPLQLQYSVYVIVEYTSHSVEVICFCYPNWSWKLSGQETHLILLLPLQATIPVTEKGADI